MSPIKQYVFLVDFLIFILIMFSSCKAKTSEQNNKHLSLDNKIIEKYIYFKIESGFLKTPIWINVFERTNTISEPQIIKYDKTNIREIKSVHLSENAILADIVIANLSKQLNYNYTFHVGLGDTVYIKEDNYGHLLFNVKTQNHYYTNFFYYLNKGNIGLNLYKNLLLIGEPSIEAYRDNRTASINKLFKNNMNYLDSVNNMKLVSLEEYKNLKELLGYMYMNNLVESNLEPNSLELINSFIRKINPEDLIKFYCKSFLLEYFKRHIAISIPKNIIIDSLSNSFSKHISEFYSYYFIKKLDEKRDPYYNTAVNKFKDKFPNSEYASLFGSKVSILSKENEIALLTNKNNIVPFKNLFNGQQYLLIDFWASWCAPCIEQFKFSKMLEQNFNKSNFKIVYISIDESIIKWRESVIKNNLSKNNNSFFISDEDREKMKKVFSITSIPRYILFDKSGKIIKNHAETPEILLKSKELETIIK